jgi:hypothetical protein
MGFMNDLRDYATTEAKWYDADSMPDVTPLYKRCRAKLDELVFSDMVLLHSPGMLAAAAFCLGAESLKADEEVGKAWEKVDTTKYFEER